jgi:hypothetical protein
MNNHVPSTHLGFCLFRYCDAKTISSRSSTCICNRESKSLEPSFSAILHQVWVNKVFGKWSLRLLIHFFKFFIMTHLPLRQMRVEVVAFNANSISQSVVFTKLLSSMNHKSPTISRLKNMLIYVCIILLDNLLQYLLFIVVIDLARTCDSTAILICNALVIFIIYPFALVILIICLLIKIKLKVLIFPT